MMKNVESRRLARPLMAAVAATVLALSGALPFDVEAQTGGRASRNMQKAKPGTTAAGPVLDRARGAKEAPAALQAAGVSCTVADAAFVGSVKDTAGAIRNVYEVACRDGLGYLIQHGQSGADTKSYDCLVVAASAAASAAAGRAGAAQCRLAGNAQPAQTLQPMVTAAGGTCTVNNARYVGSRANGTTLYEIGCAQGSGFILERPAAAGARATLINCLSVAGTQAACTLTTPAQVVASLLPVVARAGRPCTVADARVAGRNPQNQHDIIEIGCQGGAPGFLMEVNNTGGFVRALDCDRVTGLTCTFTNTAALQAAGKAALLGRVRAAGLAGCTPADARLLGAESGTGREVVEVSCSNRPYGAIALLASPTTPRNEVVDCLAAPRWGGQCQLTQASSVYPVASAAMRVRGRNPGCQINNARWMGSTRQGESWYEVACADGRSFLMDYRGAGQVASVLTCREGAEVGGGCRAGIGASVPKD
jgi:hypothetical protein